MHTLQCTTHDSRIKTDLMPPPPLHLSFVGGAPPYSCGAGIAPSTRLHGAGYLCYSLLLPSGPVCHQALSKGGPFPWPVNSFSISCLVYSCTTVCACGLEVSDHMGEMCHMGNMPHGKYAIWEIHGRSYLVVFQCGSLCYHPMLFWSQKKKQTKHSLFHFCPNDN